MSGPVQRAAGRLGVDPHMLLGLVAVAVAGVFIVATYTGVLRSLFRGDRPEVTVLFSDARVLREGDPVRVHGVTVGEVESLEAAQGGRATKAVLSVDERAGTIYADARARVAFRTLLGGALAVKLEPGRPEAGELGDRPIPPGRTSSQVELDDITSVVQGRARAGLRTIPAELASTMRDPGTVERLARTLGDVSPSVARGLGALRGVHEQEDLRRLVAETGKAVRALDAPDDALRTAVAGAAATFRATAAREADLRSTLRDAPGALRDTRTTLTALDRTLAVTEPVVRDLRDPAGQVAPALARLRPAVTGADRLLHRARPLLGQLRPAVRSLATTAQQALPLLDELQPSLDRIDDRILPYMNEPDPNTRRTAAEMVGPALGGLGNVAAPIDRNGHILRFPFSMGSSPAYLPCQVYAANPDKTRLIECRNLQEVLETYLEWDPLSPAPGTAPKPEGGR
ncbi:MAG TPA: MlaD family protein [Baekduia sp.]|nr:MlaD family protein [Baekduia sp.]